MVNHQMWVFVYAKVWTAVEVIKAGSNVVCLVVNYWRRMCEEMQVLCLWQFALQLAAMCQKHGQSWVTNVSVVKSWSHLRTLWSCCHLYRRRGQPGISLDITGTGGTIRRDWWVMKNTGNVICAACLYMQGVSLMIKTRTTHLILPSPGDFLRNRKIIMEIRTEGCWNWGEKVENYRL